MKSIKLTADIIKNNLAEARKYIHMAIEHKETEPVLASWFKNMAKAHLDFDAEGHAAAKKLIETYKESGKNSDLAPGMLAMYSVIHADLVKEEAELKAMLETLK